MKFIILLITIITFLSYSISAQSTESKLPEMLHLTIHEYGSEQPSFSSTISYKVENYKLVYRYDHNGSEGKNSTEVHATKKFPHRMQREAWHFLSDTTIFRKEENDFLEGDNSEKLIEISLEYNHNGASKSWTMKGGDISLTGLTDYKKIIEFELLLREMAGLGEK
jgi:hypothetical protein